MGKMKARARYNHSRTQQYVSNPVQQQQAPPSSSFNSMAFGGAQANEALNMIGVPTAQNGVANNPQNTQAATWGAEDVWCSYRTIPAGERVMVRWNSSGEVEFLNGPARPFLVRATITRVKQYTATGTEYLVVSWKDGRVEHVAGPSEMWFDPLEMHSIRVLPVVRLNANEAIVLYKTEGPVRCHTYHRTHLSHTKIIVSP